ncbi:MAG: HlyD family efflux transporter periplasmic adaptor subunit [Bacteroidaceae bacterium]|nr:HlyD family efflux transporter periplasmic adaptor subunit [Bacteroidaceae bacterium]
MDYKLPPKKWYVKYRIHIVAGLLGLGLIIMLIRVSTGPKIIRINSDSVQTATVSAGEFSEYVNADGTLQPIQTIKVYTREGGFVENLLVQDGALVHKGDTLMILSDPDLMRTIESERDKWRKQNRSYRTSMIEMDQRRLSLAQNILQTKYELKRLEKEHNLAIEEYKMGIKSKAQLDVADEEYNYKMETVRLQLESRRQDSVLNAIRQEALKDELAEAHSQLLMTEARLNDLIVTAPADGQLSGLSLEPSQRISSGTAIADIKRMDQFRMRLSINEFYIDKIAVGQPATITYEKKTYPMTISSTVPEIKNGSFDVFLVFTDSMPDNARIGKTYQARIEMGGQAQSIIVPKGNFYNYTHGSWVFKMNESRTHAVRVPVSIGRQNPRHFEILEGLNPGDEIIITGYDRISDADEVVLN